MKGVLKYVSYLRIKRTKRCHLFVKWCFYAILLILTPILTYTFLTDESQIPSKETNPSTREDFVVQGLNSNLIGKMKPPINLLSPFFNASERLTISSSAVKGVILFLYGGRHKSYFVKYTLPRLQLFFLDCFPKKYPVHIFHDGELSERKYHRNITSLIPSAKTVDFEDVGRFWNELPKGVSDKQFTVWVSRERKNRGKGYRIMCRFWAGLVWTLPSMDKYDYYWRLDTDSILLSPFLYDPFEVMVKNGCEYGYNDLIRDYPHFVIDLYDTYKNWAHLSLTKEVVTKVDRLVTNPHDGKYTLAMFYNNFELGSFKLKRSEIYQSLFKFIDERPPFGILRYRWGDAPIHTLGVYAALGGETNKICLFNKTEYPYLHDLSIKYLKHFPVVDKCNSDRSSQPIKDVV